MKRNSKKEGVFSFLCNVIPVAQDPPREWVRKLAFLTALLVFVGSAGYLLDDLWLGPKQTETAIGTLRDWYYDAENSDQVLPELPEEEVAYPDGMLPKFKALYRRNQEVRGWLRFAAGEGENDLFEGAIDNPVVQTSDNEYYLKHDFWGKKTKTGALYFDYRNDLSRYGSNRNLIVYGHNLTSGLMFSRFNRLASGKLERGRQLTTVTLETLYEPYTYKVFAVMVINVMAEEEPIFDALRTEFDNEDEFLAYVKELRRRSLFDFGDVDVAEGDELLTMSTCSNKRDTTLKDGRIIVVARRVREGEDPTVDVMKTAVNEDVLMPRQWYLNKGLELPRFYQEGGLLATTTKYTVMGTQTTESTEETTRSDDETAVTDGSTATTAPPPTTTTVTAAAATTSTTVATTTTMTTTVTTTTVAATTTMATTTTAATTAVTSAATAA